MSYTRVNWRNGQSGGTPLSADNLNTMDEGIKNNSEELSSLNTRVSNIAISASDDGEGNVTLTFSNTST